MKRNEFIILSFILFPLLLSACVPETIENHYPDRTSAETAGAMERGWIPEWIPDSAEDLHEMHNLDHNNSLLMFNVQTAENETWLSNCQPVNIYDPPSLQAKWWPSDLLEQPADVFACDDLFLLYQSESAHIYLWRP